MAKIMLMLLVSSEYEPNLSDYPEGTTLKDIAEIDAKNAKEDPSLILDMATDIITSYIIIDDEGNLL